MPVRNHVDDTAEAVLIAHQRFDAGNCLCGWSELGKSYAKHQVDMLREAMLLVDETRGGRRSSTDPGVSPRT
jgi:hypothetical protein